DVERGAGKPLCVRRLPVEQLRPRSAQLQLRQLALPEGFRRVQALPVQLLVLFSRADARGLAEGLTRLDLRFCFRERLDGIAHAGSRGLSKMPNAAPRFQANEIPNGPPRTCRLGSRAPAIRQRIAACAAFGLNSWQFTPRLANSH